jgi:hypothetical protein
MKLRLVEQVGLALLLIGSNQGLGSVTNGSWYLDQSNAFPDGVNYGEVTIEANSSYGTVRFTVDAFDVEPAYGGLGNNFGITNFGFNFQNLSSAPSQWTLSLPNGWSQGSRKMDGFGVFLAAAAGKGNNRQDPLVLTITLPNHAEAVAGNFAVLSTGHAGQGHVDFAAHVAGFNNGPSSHYIGGSIAVAPVPEPAGILTAGLLGFAWAGLRKYIRRPDVGSGSH